MKLRNKKTGEIIQLDVKCKNGRELKTFDLDTNTDKPITLAELNEEWEDYEEPFSTSFYTIVDGKIKHCIFYRERVAGCPSNVWAYLKDDGKERIKQLKGVGLYFKTKEEAEKAVEKLKAFKRLRDKGFRFKCWEYDDRYAAEMPCILIRATKFRDCEQDLDLLFGGEE